MFFEGVIFLGSNVLSAVQCAVVPGPPKIWTKHSNGPIQCKVEIAVSRKYWVSVKQQGFLNPRL